MSLSIWWIRRDIRLNDNPALQAALDKDNLVLPLFILDPKLLNSPYVGTRRKAFLFAGLEALRADLQGRGSRLVVRRGTPVEVLQELMGEANATQVFAQEDYSPYARLRDRLVREVVPLNLTPGVVVHHPAAVLKENFKPKRSKLTVSAGKRLSPAARFANSSAFIIDWEAPDSATGSIFFNRFFFGNRQ